MYLSQMLFNPRSRTARWDLMDRHELHRTLMMAFPDDLPDDARVLFRVEMPQYRSPISILIQSSIAPEWGHVERMATPGYLVRAPLVRPISPALPAGTQTRFRLQANPTVKRESKRHAIYGDDALLGWLERKGQQHGFAIERLNVRVTKVGKVFGKKRQQTWNAVQFEGILTVTDAALFRETLAGGVGSGKAFGFGLLSIPYT